MKETRIPAVPYVAPTTIISNGSFALIDAVDKVHADVVQCADEPGINALCIKAHDAVPVTGTVTVANPSGSQPNSNDLAQTSILSALLNSQGTQSTAGLSTSANQAIATAALTTIMNAQGTQATTTLATSANQANELALLGAIMNAQGTQATSSLATESTLVRAGASLALIANNEGTIASQTTLQTISNQLRDITNTYGATGTVHRSSYAVDVSFDDTAAVDAFSRLRVSSPAFRFDGQLTYGFPTENWDMAYTPSTGTVTHDRTNKMCNVQVFTSGTAVMQSHYYAPYTPGRSQLVLMSFAFGTTPGAGAVRRTGYFDGSNGVYLEQTSTGLNLVEISTTDYGSHSVPQNLWNIDRMDGSGPSGVTLDVTKTQILAIYLQALYAGRVTVGFDLNGILSLAHTFNHANTASVPYVAKAGLPVRWEAQSTGIGVSLKAICGSVSSEGGEEIKGIAARTFAGGNGANTITVSSRRPIASFRPLKYLNQVLNTAIAMPMAISAFTTGQSAYVEIIRNGVLTGASFSSIGGGSMMEKDVSATAISGGSVVFSTYVINTSGIPIGLSDNILSRLVLCYSQLLDTADVLSFVATSLSGNASICAELAWKEIR